MFGYNTDMKKIAIIGGGASGLMAALFAARAGLDVTIYEHNTDVGKKILASGNGRCNIINTTASSHDYASQDPSFVSYALKQLHFSYFEKICASIGLLLDVKEDGRCYPLSNEAKSVLTALKNGVKNAGVSICIDTKITKITKLENDFYVQANEVDVRFDNVLIATGSQAAPQLGATIDGYKFAKAFGHTIIEPYPSLVQLHLHSKHHSKMSGVKTVAHVKLLIEGKTKIDASGDILFTHYGISGLAILDISQQASYAMIKGKRVSLSLNLLPYYDLSKLIRTLEKFAESIPTYSIISVLCGLLPAKIAAGLLDEAQIPSGTMISRLSPKEIKKIAYLITDWKFEVTDTHGFKHAEVSGGGVSTAQINPKSMESMLVKGLYFAGEVIDVVGKRGGYNFNFAWASGMIAGREMSKSES